MSGVRRSFVAENASSWSLPRAATQTALPSGEGTTRLGLQPAATVLFTDREGPAWP